MRKGKVFVKELVKVAIFFLFLLISAMAIAEDDERGIEISVDKTSARMGELITWTMNMNNFTEDDDYEVLWDVENKWSWVDRGSFTWKDGENIHISSRIYEEGDFYLKIKCYLYGADYTYLSDDYIYYGAKSETVTVSGPSSLSVTITPDKETAHGMDEVTWTIIPSGGSPEYEIHAGASFYVPGAYGTFDEETVIISDGSPVEYKHKLWYGWDGEEAEYNNYTLYVTVIDHDGNAVQATSKIHYEDPIYQPPEDYPDVENLNMYEEAILTFDLTGSVGPYTNYTVQIHTMRNDEMIDEIVIPVVEENPLIIKWNVDKTTLLRDPYIYIVRSFTDGLGQRWKFFSTSSVGSFSVDLGGRIHTDVISESQPATIGDMLEWVITAERPFYYNSRYKNQKYDLTITPFFVSSDGTVQEADDSKLIESTNGTAFYSITAEKNGAYYLKIDVIDDYAKDDPTYAHGETMDRVGDIDVYKGTLVLPSSLEKVDEEAFSGVDHMIVIVPDNLTDFSQLSFGENNIYFCRRGSDAWMTLQQRGFNLVEKE